MSLGRLVCSFLQGRRKDRREGGCKAGRSAGGEEEGWREEQSEEPE